MVEAARARRIPTRPLATRRPRVENDFFAVSTYLSTATVLYKKGGFTPAEIQKLRDHTKAMSFEEIYYPGIPFDASATDKVLADYRNAIFSDAPSDVQPATLPACDRPDGSRSGTGADPSGPDESGSGPAPEGPARHHDGAARLACARLRGMGRHRQALRLRRATRSPTTGPISRPT